MGAKILGRFKDMTYNASHMACVIDTGEGERHVLVTADIKQRDGENINQLIKEGKVKWMMSIPDGCEVTIIGCPDGQNMQYLPSGHDLIMKVVASQALVWNHANRHWYCENNVETVMRMVNFDGNVKEQCT